MSTEHSKRAAKFTADVEKTTWHDATFWSVRQKRDKMAHELPEWEDLRELASEIKMHTITHLADYLDVFSKNLESRGVKVHWAKDAQEFNEIVLGILNDHHVKKMVKSKSMLTEECEMNPYLEKHGIDVVETDLGERIIQLLGQKPSHIVMPAIHLKREEVGKMFEEKGISKEIGNYDPTYLTRCARHHLRNQFIEAGAGMTGCNFGVAETGDCVVCTNEGNADMTTSMPKLQFTQNYVSDNWYKGGESNNALLATVTIDANFNNKKKISWDNKLEMRLGFQTSRDDSEHKFRTNTDLLRLTNKLGVQAFKNWYYTIMLQSWSQFYKGYKANDPKVYSDFMSPFESLLSIGMDYKLSKKNFNISAAISPLALKFKYVDRKELSPSFGVNAGSHTKWERGSNITVNSRWNICKQVSWVSRLCPN